MSWRGGIELLLSILPSIDKHVDSDIKEKFLRDLIELLSSYDMDTYELAGIREDIDRLIGVVNEESQNEEDWINHLEKNSFDLPESLTDYDSIAIQRDFYKLVLSSIKYDFTSIILSLELAAGMLSVSGFVEPPSNQNIPPISISKLPISWNLFLGLYIGLCTTYGRTKYSLIFTPTDRGNFEVTVEVNNKTWESMAIVGMSLEKFITKNRE